MNSVGSVGLIVFFEKLFDAPEKPITGSIHKPKAQQQQIPHKLHTTNATYSQRSPQNILFCDADSTAETETTELRKGL